MLQGDKHILDQTGVHQFAVNFVSTRRGPAAKCGGECCGLQFTWYRPLVYVSRKASLKHLRAVEGSHYVLEPPPLYQISYSLTAASSFSFHQCKSSTCFCRQFCRSIASLKHARTFLFVLTSSWETIAMKSKTPWMLICFVGAGRELSDSMFLWEFFNTFLN